MNDTIIYLAEQHEAILEGLARIDELEEKLRRIAEWCDSHYSDNLKVVNIKRIASGEPNEQG